MHGKIFNCPLSGASLAHPCPCYSCPGNLAKHSPNRSCAYQLPDMSYASLAEATGMDLAQVRSASQMQASELAVLVKDLRYVTEHVPDGACANCGYVKPCTNLTLCDERREKIEEILVNTQYETPLKARHLWFAAVTQRASFMPRSVREELRELANQKDLGEQYE